MAFVYGKYAHLLGRLLPLLLTREESSELLRDRHLWGEPKRESKIRDLTFRAYSQNTRVVTYSRSMEALRDELRSASEKDFLPIIVKQKIRGFSHLKPRFYDAF